MEFTADAVELEFYTAEDFDPTRGPVIDTVSVKEKWLLTQPVASRTRIETHA